MIKIAVVDDEKDQIEQIVKIVSDFFNQRKIAIETEEFYDGETLLKQDLPYKYIKCIIINFYYNVNLF